MIKSEKYLSGGTREVRLTGKNAYGKGTRVVIVTISPDRRKVELSTTGRLGFDPVDFAGFIDNLESIFGGLEFSEGEDQTVEKEALSGLA